MRKLFTTIACLAIGLLTVLGVAFFSPDSNPVSAQMSAPGRSTPSVQQPGQAIPNRQVPGTQSPVRPSAQLNEIDRQFMLEASQAGNGLIALSQMGIERATAADVRRFAQAELNEQQQLRTDLTRIAPTVGLSLPNAIAPKFRAAMNRLAQLRGDQFDRAFMDEVGVNAHLENAALFQREAAFGQYPELQTVVNRGLPIIRQHFTTASAFANYRFAEVPRRYGTTSAVSPRGTVPGLAQ